MKNLFKIMVVIVLTFNVIGCSVKSTKYHAEYADKISKQLEQKLQSEKNNS